MSFSPFQLSSKKILNDILMVKYSGWITILVWTWFVLLLIMKEEKIIKEGVNNKYTH